jgi:hypothetical protein
MWLQTLSLTLISPHPPPPPRKRAAIPFTQLLHLLHNTCSLPPTPTYTHLHRNSRRYIVTWSDAHHLGTKVGSDTGLLCDCRMNAVNVVRTVNHAATCGKLDVAQILKVLVHLHRSLRTITIHTIYGVQLDGGRGSRRSSCKDMLVRRRWRRRQCAIRPN